MVNFRNGILTKSVRNYKHGKNELESVDLKMSIVKPLGVKWMINFDYMKAKPDMGFTMLVSQDSNRKTRLYHNNNAV